MTDEFLNLKCPDCGSTEINLNSDYSSSFRFQCTGCGRKANKKYFVTDDSSRRMDDGTRDDFWT